MRTINHRMYIPPTKREIRKRFQDIGFDRPYSNDFVKDIANAYSHVMQGGTVEDSFIDSDNKYTSAVQNLLKNTDFSSLSGISPLEKAASLIGKLSQIDRTGVQDASDCDSLPIFDNNSSDNIEKALEKIDEDISGCKEAGDIAKEMFDMHSPETAKMYKINKFKDFLETLALLDSKSFLKTKKISKKVYSKRMSEYSQISNLTNFSAVGMPTYKYKLATKQLNVRQHKQANKQSLFLLIDDSGSMDHEEKTDMLRALLCNRLQAVYDGKAILYIGLFEKRLYKEILTVETKADAKKFAKWFPELDGGGTDIERAVKEVCKVIDSGIIMGKPIKGEKPEIVVINDGEDEVDEFIPTIKTHGIILGEDNEGMERMIKASGGTFKRFL